MDAKKTVLGLQLPTDPRWVNIAEKQIEEILVDHAFCEQKAASACISLIVQFPDKTEMVKVLTPVVAEEWGHFERVIEELTKRGFSLGHPRKNKYVIQLSRILKKGGSREDQLVEKLLINALIEARSCERFKLLWKNLIDEDLQRFYYELMISEAGHYTNFIDLAKLYSSDQHVSNRWTYFLEKEAEIMKNLEPRADRIH